MNFARHRPGLNRSEATAVSGRSPQLDGLRGIAILAVVLHHAEIRAPHFLDWGPFGVRLFFVLSAYLITRSLWRLGDDAAQGRTPYFQGLKTFHLRRIARLLPAYLAALCFGALVGLEEVRESFFWHLGFLSNFNIAMIGWFPTSTGHLWSLAVQEQFYIVWPFVLMAVPFRWFPWAAAGLVLSGYGYRVFCMVNGVPELWCWLMLPGFLDTFAAGGLLAWIQRRHGLPLPTGRRAWVMLGAGAFFWFSNRVLRFFQLGPWLQAMPDLLEAVVAALLVWLAVAGVRGPIGMVLGWGPLRFLGSISYGIFVYHLVVFHFMEEWLARSGIDRESQPWMVAVIMLAVTVPLAVLSWRFLEQPVVEWLKKKPAPPSPPAAGEK